MSGYTSKTEPLVSVIVPVYNVEKYLARCVESILAQTYKHFELVLVDDGSKDSSGALCEEFQKRDVRIQVIHKENGGLSSARNAGLRVAKGEYVVFCDSDDTVEEEWIEALAAGITEHPDCLIVCGYHYLNGDGEIKKTICAPEGYYKKERYFEIFSQTGSVCIKIFSKAFLQEKDIWFDESITYSEDVPFSINCLDNLNGFYVIGKPLYNYYHYRSDVRETISTTITYDQMKKIYDIRISHIAEEHKRHYQDMFFANIWARFNNLFNSDGLKLTDRKKEAKAIVKDNVFQEHLNARGEELFDKNSLRLLKEGKVSRYWLLQRLAKMKQSFKKK